MKRTVSALITKAILRKSLAFNARCAMRSVRDRNVRWRTSANPSRCVLSLPLFLPPSPSPSHIYIRMIISASGIGIYQGDPIVRFLIEERVRSANFIRGSDMHNEAIRLNTDKTIGRFRETTGKKTPPPLFCIEIIRRTHLRKRCKIVSLFR